MRFDNKSILLDDYLTQIKEFYLSQLLDLDTGLELDKIKYELYVDISTTHNYNGVSSTKGWQVITQKQMNNFIKGMYKIDYLV